MAKSTVSSLISWPTARALLAVYALLSVICLPAATAQPADDAPPAETAADDNADDQRIAARLGTIYAMLEPLAGVEVEVRGGVVLLSGEVSNQAQAERALGLAAQIPGVVTVDDGIERRRDVQGNLSPMLAELRSDVIQWRRALPLIAVAFLLGAVIVFLGYRLSRWSALWQRLTPNLFVAELAAQAVRIAAIITGLVIALNLLGATTLMATILGGAGVVGLAIGFAVRDTMENYISSIMLSLRQPFRANDHVVINEFEGKVVRLTSRATVLMTLDGNQLRIPNATVFKAVILNYTKNPERRFTFALGVDSADDAISAMKVGADALRALPFVLADPAANALIDSVGDSSTILQFAGWIDQRETDFGRARSLAIQAVTRSLDEQGFTLPEPIYRLRFDSRTPRQALVEAMPEQEPDADGKAPGEEKKAATGRPIAEPVSGESMDVTPDTHIDGMVNEERRQETETDLLDDRRPVE